MDYSDTFFFNLRSIEEIEGVFTNSAKFVVANKTSV